MHTLQLEVGDTVLDKVMIFLKQLPQNEVHIKNESSHLHKVPKLNSIRLHTKGFKFNREEANAR